MKDLANNPPKDCRIAELEAENERLRVEFTKSVKLLNELAAKNKRLLGQLSRAMKLLDELAGEVGR